MDSRSPAVALIVAMLVMVPALIWLAVRSDAQPTGISTTNILGGRPIVHRLVMIESEADFARGTMQGAAIANGSVVPDGSKRGFPIVGIWTSPTIEADFKFDELLPSWNLTTPEGSGGVFEARVRSAETGEFSPWLYFGSWGRVPNVRRTMEFSHGQVHVDVLALSQQADAFELRATLYSYDPGGASMPALRRFAASYAAAVESESARSMLNPSPDTSGFRRDLPVPFRAQGVESDRIKSDICSPTATSMLMQHFGVDRPTLENAMAIYDIEHDLFGNWSRATARAGALGLKAYLTRVGSIDEARAYIANGQPLIASIRFEKGEFDSNLIENGTAGHLIVIRGFDENGDAIVNDPASIDRGHGVIYKADELSRAWITNAGGVTYVINREPSP